MQSSRAYCSNVLLVELGPYDGRFDIVSYLCFSGKGLYRRRQCLLHVSIRIPCDLDSQTRHVYIRQHGIVVAARVIERELDNPSARALSTPVQTDITHFELKGIFVCTWSQSERRMGGAVLGDIRTREDGVDYVQYLLV